MPRKRDEAAVEAIRNVARTIMMNEGYEAMTYSELARQTGLPRGTVQYYFPKKEELAKDLMGTIADLATVRARQEYGEEAPDVTVMYATSQLVVGLYFSTPGLRQFMLDISTSRKLQHAVSPDWVEWMRQLSGKRNLAPTQKQIDAMSMANGAVYEMYYIYLSEGRTPVFAETTREGTLAQARALGLSTREAKHLMNEGTLTQERTQQIVEELLAQLAAATLKAA